ncbi:hypothetical protein CDO87_26280 (plasmid) [Sagittula sp. P11]|uniref:arylsulfotransferase family protein n=1 Tax=unclassified Sagittula TaxID=2624628 RepID=UPI000C2CEC10|nr:arylsulfotransferase family protein [Sagittula sp. P11]AUC56783.1 hypothetical protein CDO87_26280 [Sagittula sp. P11]
MNRSVPVWLVLFLLLLAALTVVGISWATLRASASPSSLGVVGKGSLVIARFPDLVVEAVDQVWNSATGSADIHFTVPLDDTIDSEGFTPLAEDRFGGLGMRRGAAEPQRGWRLLSGVFSLDGGVENAVVLLSPDLEVAQVWTVDDKTADGAELSDRWRRVVHGVDMLPDGSVVFTWDGVAGSLQRLDACGNRMWTSLDTDDGAEYHHSVTLTEDKQSMWTLDRQFTLSQVSSEDGSVMSRITAADIENANLEHDLFGPRMQRYFPPLGTNSRDPKASKFNDLYHANDVDPLPASLADRFPMFDAGDLLVSLRSLNLLFVVDPETAKIKWWRMGDTRRQHDPDWGLDGRITVLDNRMGQDHSVIRAIDPETYRSEAVFDGADHGIYTRVRGKHQILEDGTVFFASSQQGFAAEIGPDGTPVLEFLNLKPDTDPQRTYTVTQYSWWPEDYLSTEYFECSSAN